MDYDHVRLLSEMGSDIRSRFVGSEVGGTASRYAKLVATLLATIVADARTRPLSEARFLALLRDELAISDESGLTPELAARVRQLRIQATNMRSDQVTGQLGALLADLWRDGSEPAVTLATKIMSFEAPRRDTVQAGWEAEFGRARHGASDSAQGGPDSEELGKIQAFLRDSFGDSSLVVADVQVVVGGYSKQTLFLRLEGATAVPAEVVVRRDRAVTAIDTTVANEFALVRALHEAGIAVARPLTLYPGGNGDFAYMVSERVTGSSIGDPWIVNRPSKAVAVSLARQLARLHALPLDSFSGSIDGAGVTIGEYMERALAGTESRWRDIRQVSPVIDAALAWVRAHLDDCEGARSLVHRDVGCHNMLVGDDDTVAALLDWETVWAGHRARDLSYVRAMVTQCLAWDQFRAAYEAAGGVWPSERELRFYSVWGDVQAAVECLRSGDLFFSGQTDNISFGYSGIYNAERFLQRIARTLAGQA